MKKLLAILFTLQASLAFGQLSNLGVIAGSRSRPVGAVDTSAKAPVTPPVDTVVVTPPGVPTYTLASPSTVSVGIYKSDGTLVRTLEAAKVKAAGPYNIVWDGTDDLLQAQPVAQYTAKIATNNIIYDWQGVIGNTSTNQTGGDVHRSLDPAIAMVIAGTKAYYAIGYGEGEGGNGSFLLSDIQKKLLPMPYDGTGQNTEIMATDGTNIYWAGHSSFEPSKSFVFATKLSDKSEVIFSAGISFQPQFAHNYASAIGYLDQDDTKITGLAVSSNYIFISKKNLNQILVLNKTTGAVAQTVTFGGPGALTVSGSTLWIASGNAATKATINGDGTITTTGTTSASTFAGPIHMSNNGSIVAVIDGGSSQQIKAFDINTGATAWVLGDANGNNVNPAVTNTRFAFWKRDQETAAKLGYGSIAFAPDGSFWVCDPGNFRMLHYSSATAYIEQIQYTGRSYNLAVDLVDHSRVISTMLEYQVDYTSSIKNSWVLKYNWDGTFNSAYDLLDKIKHMRTYSNGRTYAMMFRKAGGTEIVELDPVNGIRYTGIVFTHVAKIYEDGSVGEMQNGGVDETQYFRRYTHTGYSGANPTFSSAVLIAIHTNTSASEPRNGSIKINPVEVTSTGILALYKGSRVIGEQNSFHLGGFDISTGTVKWKTQLSNFDAYTGDFPRVDAFEVGNFGSEQGGQGDVVIARDRSIFTHYYGEYWKSPGQTNIFNHYLDNGLPLGQFGITSDEVSQPADVKFAGNAFSSVLIKEGNDYYIYQNDESQHGGTHRWKISGISTIAEQSITIPSSFVRTSEVVTVGSDLMAGLPKFSSNLPNNTNGWTRSPASNVGTDWEVTTSRRIYGARNNPDLYITWSTPQNASVTRTLGNNTNVAVWKVSGKVSFNSTMPSETNKMVVKVLDNAGKIIAQFNRDINFSDFIVRYKANTTEVGTATRDRYELREKRSNALEFTRSGNNIIYQFSNFAPVTLPLVDNTAAIGNPAKLVVEFQYNGGGIYGKHISLENFVYTGSNQ
ncbi:hypothetical protein [Segetibacter aerophilus]|uniref:FlgD Ig-like domain-containing protein n=1 Tax=Segetibacter aerophilus TaxID=670293 RepID=A0A512B9Y6_9BACT|nr:hypothetical protein [Segetibacter aerophilus]GEO08780.1 hypothetical protein SAE01_12760 [Segetibacter aerophilus]